MGILIRKNWLVLSVDRKGQDNFTLFDTSSFLIMRHVRRNRPDDSKGLGSRLLCSYERKRDHLATKTMGTLTKKGRGGNSLWPGIDDIDTTYLSQESQQGRIHLYDFILDLFIIIYA